MKGYEIGNSDFIRAKRNGFPLVDKSGFIKALWELNEKVCLITRPRRFGKTMNLGMLDAYLNLGYKEEGKEWFKGMEIENHEDMRRLRNAFPVIRMSFSDLRTGSTESFMNGLKTITSEIYKNFKEQGAFDDAPEYDTPAISSIILKTANEDDVIHSIKLLCRVLHRHYGVAPVVLIDEYDKPVTDTYNESHHEEILGIMRDFLRLILKDNVHLTKCVITGVSQVAKESMFSDLNNLYVNNILSTDLDEWFGFTEMEVSEILVNDDGIVDENKMRIAKEWYDGYVFGNTEVYNPWSILMYNNTGKAGKYWIETGGDRIVNDLLKNPDEEMQKKLERLLSNEGLPMDVRTEISMRDLGNSPEDLFSMLLVAGYLTAVPIAGNSGEDVPIAEGRIVKIPNMEVRRHLAAMVAGMYNRGTIITNMTKLTDAVISGNENDILERLPDVMEFFFPYGKARYEEGYQTAFMACLAFLGDRFDVKSEYVAGSGRADIWVRRLYGPGCNMVLEIKRVEEGQNPDILSGRALEQILNHRYTAGLKGRTPVFGIALGEGKPSVIRKELFI